MIGDAELDRQEFFGALSKGNKLDDGMIKATVFT